MAVLSPVGEVNNYSAKYIDTQIKKCIFFFYVKTRQNGGWNSLKALHVPFPFQWGLFWWGGNRSFQVVWQTDLIGSQFGTNTKLLEELLALYIYAEWLSKYSILMKLLAYWKLLKQCPPMVPTGKA